MQGKSVKVRPKSPGQRQPKIPPVGQEAGSRGSKAGVQRQFPDRRKQPFSLKIVHWNQGLSVFGGGWKTGGFRSSTRIATLFQRQRLSPPTGPFKPPVPEFKKNRFSRPYSN